MLSILMLLVTVLLPYCHFVAHTPIAKKEKRKKRSVLRNNLKLQVRLY